MNGNTNLMARPSPRPLVKKGRAIKDPAYLEKQVQDKFWSNASGSLKFDPEALHELLKEHGFGILKSGNLEGAILIKVEGCIIKMVSNKEIRDYCWRYICEKYKFQDPGERKQVKTLFYKEKSLFNYDNLLLMPVMEINEIKDTADTSFLFFKNCVMRISQYGGIEKLSYDELSGHVFETDIIDFSLETDDVERNEGEFYSFLKDICSHEDPETAELNLRSLESIIGYMLHRYKDPANIKAIVLMDPYRGEGANGSSGKSLLTELFKKVRPTIYEDGKSFNAKDRFALSQIDYNTRILVIDDIPSNFDFNRLFPLITQRAVVERKYQNRYVIGFERSPKIIITTNYTIHGADESTRRRKMDFILADLYKTDYTPEMKYGHLLFLDWDNKEWENFYLLTAWLIWEHLEGGLVMQKLNVHERALKMHAHPKFIQYMEDNVGLNEKYNKKEVYNDFYSQNPNVGKVELTTFRFWLKLYADSHGYKLAEPHSGEDNFFQYSLE